MTYLLDTNVLSEVRKKRPHPAVASWLEGVSDRDLFVSVLVLGEIRLGVERLRRRDASQAAMFEDWLTTVESAFMDRVIAIDSAVAQAWGRISAGVPLPVVDGLMAATALVHGLIVVSRDVDPFERADVPWLDPWASAAG